MHRVLMSRARKGVCDYFMDPETEMHFRSALPQLLDSN
jgi:hypothetical protein